MNITHIRHIAGLCCLKLSPEQEKHMLKKLSGCMELIGRLNEVNVSDMTENYNFPHVEKNMSTQTSVHSSDGRLFWDQASKNITHPLRDRGVVVKSALENK